MEEHVGRVRGRGFREELKGGARGELEGSSEAEQGIRGTMWNAMGVLKDGATIQKTPRRRPEAGPACVDIAFPGDLPNAEISLVVRLGPRGDRTDPKARASGAENLKSTRKQVITRTLSSVLRAKVAPDHAQA